MSIDEKPNNFPIALLDEKKNIVALNSEHESILEQITESLGADKYNSIVTMENYKVMKESATELNKTANLINKFKIEKVKLETEDIESFKSNCKLYCDSIQSKRETILKGLSTFEEETEKQVLIICKENLEKCLNELQIRPEFRNIDVSDMTATGYMTATGNISKKGKDEIIARVNVQNQLQAKVDNRILSLENQCLKAGIEPLTVEHIQGFLYEDDEVYENQLLNLIDAEFIRNEKIKEQERIKAEQEAKAKVIAEQKALKAELEARYLGRIRTATIDQLIVINLELQSYDASATYELKQLCNQRQLELEKPVEEVQKIDETPQEEHLKAIQSEPIKEVVENKTIEEEIEKEKPKEIDGKVLKTISCSISVPVFATDEQVKDAVFGMIQSGQITADNFEVN